jgi:hypothetical protein
MPTTCCQLLVGGCCMRYFPQSGSLQYMESDDCDFVVYCVWIMETSCIVLFGCTTGNEARVLYYGFIASFIG